MAVEPMGLCDAHFLCAMLHGMDAIHPQLGLRTQTHAL